MQQEIQSGDGVLRRFDFTIITDQCKVASEFISPEHGEAKLDAEGPAIKKHPYTIKTTSDVSHVNPELEIQGEER